MDLSTQDYLKKAILDTQERVRDYMSYADIISDSKLARVLRTHAEIEGRHAEHLRGYLSKIE